MLYNEAIQTLMVHPANKNFFVRDTFLVPKQAAMYLEIAVWVPAQVREKASIKTGEVSWKIPMASSPKAWEIKRR